MDDMIDLRMHRVYDDEENSEEFSSDTSDHGSEGDTPNPSPFIFSYDTSLPALHSYLGNDLEELSGRTVLDDGSLQTIPILSLPGVVLIPGQILPLQLYNPVTISVMIPLINSDRTFGLINSRFSGRQFGSRLDSIGTTAEIRSYSEEEAAYGSTVLRIKAEGRQRFEVLEITSQSRGILMGKVRILPELCLPNSGESARLNSLNKFLIPPPNLKNRTAGNASPCKQLLHRSSHKYNKFDFANYTSFPEFVYKMYDTEILMNRIKQMLRNWNKTSNEDCMPCNPKEFSYWIAANLPLDDNQKLNLLKINEVTERLRHELKILEESSVMCCKDCQNIKAYREDIFSMSLQGPQGTYVNSTGYVHEAITVLKATGLLLVGRPSTEQSWFPGYAWTIVECGHCHCHLGWRFTSVDKSLKPKKFWALTRSAIQTRIGSSDDASDTDYGMYEDT